MKKLNLKWVTDTIGEEYKKWQKGDIVKIQAQTGTGKTYFIKNKLIPSMESYEHMLIVANRINLKRQLKKDLITYYKEEMPKTLDDLDLMKTIGNVTILSYQTISELKNADNYNLTKLDLNYYDYIICDECHFFMSDGAFNNKCDLAWEELVRVRYRNAIKIFISATMQEIEGTIDASVDKIHKTGFGTYKKCKLYNYSTGIDYSYLKTRYFNNIKDIATLIKNNTTKEKWIVFVTKKSDAEYINKFLDNIKSVSIITKDTDINKNEDLQKIITDSKYNCDVLVCTKAMDNGINIADNEVKNIVIMAWDNVSFIQELGRVRMDINNAPQLNLYIPTMSWSAFNTLISKKYKPKDSLCKLHDKDPIKFNSIYDRNYNKLPIDLFINTKNGWEKSLIGYSRFIKDFNFAEYMCKNFNDKNDMDAKKFAYVKEQLTWINQLDTFNTDNLIEDIVDDTEVKTLEGWLKENFDSNTRFKKEEFIISIENIIKNNLGNTLDDILNKLDGRHKTRTKGINKYNQLFKLLELPFVVGSKRFKINNKLETRWIIIKVS